jgi:excisionase family DNA binding protein
MTTELTATLLTAEEVGRLLRLKPATVYEAASDGRIPCVRLWQGRRKALIRFRRDQIQALMQDRSTSADRG